MVAHRSMKQRKFNGGLIRQQRLSYLIAIVLTLSIIAYAFKSTNAQDLDSSMAEQAVQLAWEKAHASGSYGYRVNVKQTIYPAPLTTNAGRAPQVDRLGVAGSIDQDHDTMSMTLWPDGSFDPNRGTEIKVEGGQTYARTPSGDWEKIDNIASSVAPGNDPLAFLAGVDKLQAEGTETIAFDAAAFELVYDVYSFEFNGAAFSEHVNTQAEQLLRQETGMPNGIELEPNRLFEKATGTGQIWLDANGLPARLMVNFDLGRQSSGETIRAEVTTDYSDFDLERIDIVTTSFWQDPTLWLDAQIAFFDLMDRAAFAAGNLLLIVAISVGGLWVVIRYRRTRVFYTFTVSCFIAAMVFGPFLQVRSAYAFQGRLHEYTHVAADEETDVAAEVEAALASNQWDPHQDPAAMSNLNPAAPINSAVADVVAQSGGGNVRVEIIDTDGDGLSDADEDIWRSCATPSLTGIYCEGVADATDSDGDGLTDGEEVNALGTHPAAADTDGDLIADNLEVQGFMFGGQIWYLNPLSMDTNRDGIADGIDCPVLVDYGSSTYDPNGSCVDTDGDGQPDVFDNDNDGDGVEDILDLSPNNVLDQTFNYSNPFEIVVEEFATDKPLTVDFQLRPLDAKHLSLNGHVLDWPNNDTAGQIQRRNDTTFADTANMEARSTDPRAANGDVRVIPMLEITIPYSEGHYGNLPVNAANNGIDRTLAVTTTSWLETTNLQEYGIVVTESNDDNGDLVAFVPLQTETSHLGEIPQTFRGTMFYEPNDALWGNAHEVQLIWIVQMLENSRCEFDDPDTSADCDQYAEDVEVVHIYRDEAWELTGLVVTEHHGADLAILYEDPQVDNNLSIDDPLTVASWNMGQSWLIGLDCDAPAFGDPCAATTDGARDVTLANLESTINGTWDPGDTDYIKVDRFAFDHTAPLYADSGIRANEILSTVFGNYAEQTNPTLLFASEFDMRSLQYGDSNQVTVTGNQITLSLTDDVKNAVTTDIRWVTYSYDANSAEWGLYGIEQQLTTMVDKILLDASENYFNDPEDSDAARQEKREAVQLYYLTLAKGVSGLIHWQGGASSYQNAPEAGTTLIPFDHAKTATGARHVAFRILSLSYVKDVPQILKGRNIGGGHLGSAMGQVAVAMFVISTALTIAAEQTGNQDLAEIAEVVAVATITLDASVRAASAARDILFTAQGTDDWAKVMTKISPAAQFRNSAIGLVLDLALIWGTFLVMAATETGWSGFAFNALLARAIADTIIAVVVFIISVVAPYGAIFVALFWAILEIIRLASDNTINLRKAIQDAVTNAVYQAGTIVENMDDGNRLSLYDSSETLEDPDLGFVPANAITVTLDFNSYVRTTGDRGEDGALKPVFRYRLTGFDSDGHEALSLGEMANEWTLQTSQGDLFSDRVYSYLNYLNLTRHFYMPLSLLGTGVNVRNHYVLNESFALPIYECWGNFGTVSIDCDWTSENDTLHYLMYSTYDILPDTLDEFVRLDWSSWPAHRAFPNQSDQRWSGRVRGISLDLDPDSDDDGLADAYEVRVGTTDSAWPDTDRDGLTDREELLYGTNPQLSDTDGDGLSDVLEIKTGWIIDYGSGTTRVWSDPLQIDADGDRFSDRIELLLALNPNVASDPSEVEEYIQIKDMAVYESAAPQLFLRFDEDSANDTFTDDSGNQFVATCDGAADACPVAAQDGRYGSSIYLDGVNDSLAIADADEIDFGVDEDFTVSVWVKPDAVQPDMGNGDNDVVEKWATGASYPYVIRYLNSGANQGKIRVGRYDITTGGNPSITSNTLIDDGKFHHIVFTKQGETLSLYVDGVWQQSVEDTTTNDTTNTSPIYLGKRGNDRNFFAGYLDEFLVYDRGMDIAEVQNLYNGRYNLNDLTFEPGQEIAFSATVSNTNTLLSAGGFMRVEGEFLDFVTPLTFHRFENEDLVYKFASSTDSGAAQLNAEVTCIGYTCPDVGIPFTDSGTNAVEFLLPDDVVYLPTIHVPQDNISTWLDLTFKIETLPASGSVSYLIDTANTAGPGYDLYLDSNGDVYEQVEGEAPVFIGNFAPGQWHDLTWRVTSNPDLSDTADAYVGPGTLGNNASGTAPFVGLIDNFNFGNSSVGFDESSLGALSMIDRVTEAETGHCFSSGALPSCPSIAANGVLGDAVSFSGSDTEYIELENEVAYDLNHFTIAGWVKILSNTTLATNATVIGKGSDAWGLRNASTSSGTDMRLAFYTNGLSNQELATNADLSDGQWHHVAAVYNGQQKSIYIDGQLDAVVAADGVISMNDQLVTIGADPSLANSGFNGAVDELMVFPGALGEGAIQSLIDGLYPGLVTGSGLTTFSLAPESSIELEGSATIGNDPWNGAYEFEQQVAATILSDDAAVFESNVINANLMDHFTFDDSPGSRQADNAAMADPFYDANCDKEGYDVNTGDVNWTSPEGSCPTLGVPGVIGTAAYFDGLDDSYWLTQFNGGLTFHSLAVWVKADRGTILDFDREGGATKLILGFEQLYTGEQGGIWTTSDGTLSYQLPENVWTHLVITEEEVGVFGGTKDEIVIYINGQEVARGTGLNFDKNSRATIGARRSGQDPLHGYLDDLRLYSEQLTAEQVQELYSLTGPLLEFEFNEGEDETAFEDSSFNQVIGQPTGEHCTTLTLDSLTGSGVAANNGQIFANLQGNPILSQPITSTNDVDLAIDVPLCGQQTLDIGHIAPDGTAQVLSTVMVDAATGFANTPQSQSSAFSNPAVSGVLNWTIDNDPYFQANPAPGTDGQIGNIALFDGNGYIEIEDATPLAAVSSNAMTFMAWVNPNDIVGTQRILDTARMGSAANGFGVGLSGSQIEVESYGTAGLVASNANAIIDGIWQHMAVVVDQNQTDFYVNGLLVYSGAGLTLVDNTDDALLIGANLDASGNMQSPFAGQLDELKVFGRALSSNEVDAIFSQEIREYSDYLRVYLQVDKEAPTVEWADVTDYRQPGYHQLLVTAADVHSRVALVDFGLKVPGATEYSWVNAPECLDVVLPGAAFCPSFDTTLLTDWEGRYEARFRAVDAVGNETLSPVYTFYVDGGAPVISAVYNGNWETATVDPNDGQSYSVALSGTILDPQLTDGQAGSGVLTESAVSTTTLSITLVDDTGLELQTQDAVTDGVTWSIDYDFAGSRPVGLYTIMAAAEDNVGNETGPVAVGTIRLDTHTARTTLDPNVDLTAAIVTETVSLITQTTTLAGVVSDQPYMGRSVARFHFEEAAGSTSFTDFSGLEGHASCANCPASVAGHWGQALSFNASNQYVSFPSPIDPGNSAFTAAAWVNVDAARTATSLILAQQDGTGIGRSWLYVNGNDQFASTLGSGMNVASGATTTPGSWQHVAVTYDGETLALYVDGQLEDTNRTVNLEAADGDMIIGLHKELGGNPFRGLIDEVVVYDRALLDSELYALAQQTVNGVGTPEVAVVTYDPASGDTGTPDWQPVTLNSAAGSPLSTWSYQLPDVDPGFYEIQMRGSDNSSNADVTRTVWSSGIIDTEAPEITLFAANQNTNPATTLVNYTISDFVLAQDSINHLCGEAERTIITYTDANHPYVGEAYQIDATCTVAGHVGETASMTACDAAGLCITQAASSLDPSLVAYWPFEEGSGSTFADQTGNGHDGTLRKTTDVSSAIAEFSTDTPLGNGYSIHIGRTSGSAVGFGEVFADEPNSPFDLNVLSLSMWVKIVTANNDAPVFTRGWNAWGLQTCDGANGVNFFTVGLSTEDLCSSPVFSDDEWHHVTAVFDGSTKYLYIDGVLDRSISVTGTVQPQERDITMGWENSSQSLRDAYLDDIYVYGRALSAVEAVAAYTGPIVSDESVTTAVNTTANINVLANDIDNEGDTLTVTSVSQGAHGGVVNHGTHVTYHPQTNYVGDDSFTYQVSDGTLFSTGFVSVTVAGSNLITYPTATEPIGYWPLDEAGGPKTTDISSNANHGILNGDTAWITGPLGRAALTFDGADDYVEIPNESMFDLNVMTVAMWVKEDGTVKQSEAYVVKGDAWGLRRCNNNGTVQFVTTGLGANSSNCSNTVIDDGQWHHVAGVWDGTTKSIYVDGVLDFTTSASGTVRNNGSSVMFGDMANSSGNRFLGGELDEVLIYDQALSAEEIAQLATIPPVTPVGETGTVVLSNSIDGGVIETVTMQHSYTDPVVVAFINTRSGIDPVQVRVTNVTNGTFDIFMQEAVVSGLTHAAESVSYIVMEAGRHTLDGGLVVEAGTIDTATYHIGGVPSTPVTATFSEPFATIPAVLHSLNSYNNNAFMSSIVLNVSNTTFNIEQESAETGNAATQETIGWIAFSTGSGTTNGYAYEIGIGDDGSSDGVTQTAHPITFSSFAATPVVVVKGNTRNGTDGYWARGAGQFEASGHTVFAEEDLIRDTEQGHANEVFAYAAFEAGTLFYADSAGAGGLAGAALGSLTSAGGLTTIFILLAVILGLLGWFRPWRRRRYDHV